MAKRDAHAKTTKATQADYDAQLKKLADDRKAAMAAAEKTSKGTWPTIDGSARCAATSSVGH